MLFSASSGGGATTIRIGVIAHRDGLINRLGASRPLARRIVGDIPWDDALLDISKRLVGVVAGGPNPTPLTGPASSQYLGGHARGVS